MANSFSDLSDRASGALSGFRNRFGSSRRRDDDYDGYDDYDYGDYADYGEYGYDPDEPYDDYTGAEGIGEVRMRSVSPSTRNHPPLVSFDEARTNTYVPDRLMRDPLERRATSTRSTRYSGYTPRVRDSVNVGYASEYDFASVGSARIDESGVEIPPVDVVGSTPPEQHAAPPVPGPAVPAPAPAAGSGSGAARALYSKPGERSFVPARKLKVLAPASYGEVEAVAHALKAGDAVVLSLSRTPDDLAKRVLDFSFGVASALDASVECVADKTFAVCRNSPLTPEERTALESQGAIR